MPSLAALHPQVVHFVVALILVGVALRWASLAWRVSWLTPAATTLVALGTLASLVAVRSGTDAHGPVEARAGRAGRGGGPRNLGRAGPQRVPAAAGG